MGQVKCPKMFPNPSCIHVLLFVTRFRVAGCFSHPSFIHVGLSRAAEASCVFLLHVFNCFPHFPCLKNLFLCCRLNGQQKFMIFGCIAVVFFHAMPIIVVEFELLILGCFSPFYQSVFCCKTFFLHPEFCILLCVHILPLSKLVCSGIGFELA